MALVYTFPTSATLAGARDVNRTHRAMAQDDVGLKLERLISAVSILQSAVSAINVLQSAVSTQATITAWSALSNFRA